MDLHAWLRSLLGYSSGLLLSRDLKLMSVTAATLAQTSLTPRNSSPVLLFTGEPTYLAHLVAEVGTYSGYYPHHHPHCDAR